MQETHVFYLTSGVECEIRHATMADREFFTNAKYLKDFSSIPRFLASVIVRVGNRQDIGYKLPAKTENSFDVMHLIDSDTNLILVMSHVFDSDMDMQYDFDYIFEGYRKRKVGEKEEIVPTKLQNSISVDLSLLFGTAKPYMIPVYEGKILEKWQVFAPEQASEDASWIESLGGVAFECVTFEDYYAMLETLQNLVFYDKKGVGYSFSPIALGVGMSKVIEGKKKKNTSFQLSELEARKVSILQDQPEGEPLHIALNYNEMPPKTMKFLQDTIRKMEGFVDMIIEFENKAYLEERFEVTNPKTYPTYKQNLMTFPDFLYRTEIH